MVKLLVLHDFEAGQKFGIPLSNDPAFKKGIGLFNNEEMHVEERSGFVRECDGMSLEWYPF